MSRKNQENLKNEFSADGENMSTIDLLKNTSLRIVATFAASGLGVIGAGTIAGVPIWKAVFMAGIGGVATVVEGLSRAFLDDGKITKDEIDAVFNKVDRKKATSQQES